MENSTNLTNKNNSIGISNNPTSSSFSGSVSVGGNLVSGGNFGDYANLSYVSYSPSSKSVSPVADNTTRSTEQSEIDEEIKQPIENNSPEITSQEGCCSLNIQELGCGNVMSFWCFNLAPSCKGINLICLGCCLGKRDKSKANEIKQSADQQQENPQQEQQAQIQVKPK